jgi:hypothetical protein
VSTLPNFTSGFPILPIALSWAGKVTLISLGVVAAIIAVVLFVASRSRWGQNKPLTKCFALAVLAHVWLLMYAYGTRIERHGPGSGSDIYSNLSTAIEFVELPVDVIENNSMEAPNTLETTAQLDEPATFVEQPSIFEVPSLLPATEPAAESPTTSDPKMSDEPDVAPEKVELPELAVVDMTPNQGIDSPNVVSDSPTSVAQGEEKMDESNSSEVKQSEAVLTGESKPSTEVAERTQQDALLHDLFKEPSPPTPLPEDRARGVDTLIGGKNRTRFHDQQPVPEAYQLRLTDERGRIAEMFGGDASTEAAVESALAWLAANQEADGSWNAARHGAGHETRTMNYDRQGTGSKADTGMTGLALLAFLGAGYTQDQGKYAETVANGLGYLVNAQMPSGDLAGPKQVGAGDDVRYARMYCHGMALIALGEAFAMTGDRRLIDAVHRGAAYTLRAQNPQSGGWRYQIQITGDPGDLSQFGWQAMALQSARYAGVAMTPAMEMLLRRFLDSVGRGQHGGLAVYRPVPGQQPTASMTAEALATRRLIGYSPTRQADDEAVQFILNSLPGRSEENVYFWYYATIALFHRQDAAWHTWNESLKSHLVSSQQTSSPLLGSWDPRCVWSGYGGRVYSTAMSCLCLEVYYRYLPIYSVKPSGRDGPYPTWQAIQPMPGLGTR